MGQTLPFVEQSNTRVSLRSLISVTLSQLPMKLTRNAPLLMLASDTRRKEMQGRRVNAE